jgi:hypothetical protein
VARLTIIPFIGMRVVESGFDLFMLILWLVLPAIGMTIMGLRYFWQRRELSLGLCLLMGGTYFATIMPPATWFDPIAAFRVATSLVVTSILFIGWHSPKQMKWLAILWMPTALVFFMLIQVLRPG